jgi:ABC transporter
LCERPPKKDKKRSVNFFPLEVRRVPKVERDREVARIAKLLRIGSILDYKPSQLSGGQQQRVSLGRALILPRNLSGCLLLCLFHLRRRGQGSLPNALLALHNLVAVVVRDVSAVPANVSIC